LQKLPLDVASQFPALLTKKSGIDLSVLRLLRPLFSRGVGPDIVAGMVSEFHHLKFSQSELAYLAGIKRLSGQPTAIAHLRGNSQSFSDFSDPAGYCGRVPSGKYLQGIFCLLEDSLRAPINKLTEQLPCYIASIDHSFKVSFSTSVSHW